MIRICLRALALLDRKSRVKYWLLVAFRALAGMLDLIAVLAVGLLVSEIAAYSAGTLSLQNIYVTKLFGYPEPQASRQIIVVLAVLTITFFSLKSLVSSVLVRKVSYFLADQEIRAAGNILRGLSEQKLSIFKTHSEAEILFSIKQGTQAAFGGLLLNFGTLIAESFMFVSMSAVFLSVSPSATLLLVGVISAIGLFMHFVLGKRIQNNSAMGSSASVSIDLGLKTYLDGYREIISAGKESKFLQDILGPREQLAKVTASQSFLQSLPRFLIETTVIVIVLGLGLVQVIDVNINKTATTLSIFIAGGMRIVAAMIPLQAALGQLRQYIPEAKYALELIGQFPKAGSGLKRQNQKPNSSKRKAPDVSIEKVSFSYGQPNKSFLFGEVNLKINSGTQVALIGKSGSGKSTLADLIMGVIEPNSGKIQIAGVPVTDFVSKRPGKIGYVPQKPFKAPGTVAQNIAIGVEENEIDVSWLKKCLNSVGLLDYLETLPDGISTDISKMKLSGGQLQRIGIARALYRKPEILILDEVTASLDVQSEKTIIQVLTSLKGKVTTLVIAHRLATVENSDIIYVLENGKIVDSGNYRELSNNSKQFKRYLGKK